MSKHRRLGSVFQNPEPAPQREGLIDERGYNPGSGYMFVIDEKEQRQYFLHVRDSDSKTVAQLRPGVRIAFDAVASADGRRPRAQRVRILG